MRRRRGRRLAPARVTGFHRPVGGMLLSARCFGLITTIAVATACSPEGPVDVPSAGSVDAGPFSLSGYVLKGPVSGATVTAYKLHAYLDRGDLLATTTTGEDGSFGLTLPPYNGDVLLVATGGSYVEEALPPGDDGKPRRLTLDRELLGVALDVRTGQPATANITPISDLAVHLARFHVRAKGQEGHQALADAFTHLNAHFGNVPGVSPALDWQTFVPVAPPSGSGVQLTPADRANLVLAGLSQLALNASVAAGLSPGGKVNALSLVSALADDVEADGHFDGIGIKGPLVLPTDTGIESARPVPLDASTVRLTLASAIADFVTSPENASGLTVPDVGGLVAALSANADPYLFRTPGTTFDVSPPSLTIVVPPPAYTNQPTVSFSIGADDGPSASGVKSVFVRNGDGQVIPGTRTDAGVWSFADAPVGALPDFDVWAVDQAGNSGERLPLGERHLRLPCLKDTAPPVVVQDFTVPSDRDERLMALAGARVPPVFAWPGNPPTVPIGPGPEHSVWKTSVRLSWGSTPPTGAELETANAANVPFLQVAIPFNPATDAPIASVTFRISTAGAPDATGPLVPAARTALGLLYFDLPLSLETFPALASARTSPVAFTVTVTATDAAGNVTTVPLGSSDPAIGSTFFFHILGPPLFVEEDTSYPSTGDPKSVFPFSLAAGTYAAKFAGDNGGEPARVARFRVWNPYPVAVPITASVSGFSAAGSEQWDDLVWSTGTRAWDVLGGACNGAELSPCVWSPGTPQPFQAVIDGPFACEPATSPTSHANPPADVFSTTVGQLTVWTSGTERPADGYGTRVLVPPAVGTDAGSVVLYAGRPAGAFGLPPYVFTTLGNPDGMSRYLRFVQDAYVQGPVVSRAQCDCDLTVKPPVCLKTEVHTFDQRRWTRALTAASERFSGSLSVTPFARSAPDADLGEGVPSALPFSGTPDY